MKKNQMMQHWKKASMVAIAATALLCGSTPLLPTYTATAKQIKYKGHKDKGWEAVLHVARMTSTNQLVLQMDVLNKPATSYANAVYMVYARHNQKWVQVYNTKGARLIAKESGRIVLEPEVINLQDIQNRLGSQVDLSRLELKTVAMLRYDERGKRDQVVQFEQVQQYSTISQTNSVQLASTRPDPAVIDSGVSTSVQQTQSRFSLSIVQKKPRLSKVIARVSLKKKQGSGFSSEQYIGDFRYKLNKNKTQIARFINGPTAGDRVVVRLFGKKDQLIGYSEFEILANNSTVSLILPERAQDEGIVRTVYGIDSNSDYRIDQSAQVYDYFTQVSQTQRYQDARVTFFSSGQSFNLRQFEIAGVPVPRQRCVYPSSFTTGAFILVDRQIQTFSSNLASTLTVMPGELVQIADINTANVSIYQINELIDTHQRVSAKPADDDDNNDD